MTKRLTPEGRKSLMAVLKGFYDAVAAEPTPQSFHDTLRKLK